MSESKDKEALLEARNIKKYFRQRVKIEKKTLADYFKKTPKAQVKAVDGVSFTVYKGEALGLIGESGCGKTTVSRLVMNLITPTDGEIIFKGEKVDKTNIMKFRKSVQMVFQDPYSSLDSKMNIKNIVEEPLRVHTKLNSSEREKVIVPILERIGLNSEALEKYPHEFSGGQRQRIGIARALATQPEMLICDEPVSALDVSIQASILNLFKQLQKELGLSYLFISHDMSVVRHISDRIAVMYLGKLVEVADTDELFENTMHPYTEALMKSIPVPDPEHKHFEDLLPGEPPSPINPPKGCSFHERCPYARKKCSEETPELKDMGANHLVACHYCLGGGKKC